MLSVVWVFTLTWVCCVDYYGCGWFNVVSFLFRFGCDLFEFWCVYVSRYWYLLFVCFDCWFDLSAVLFSFVLFDYELSVGVYCVNGVAWLSLFDYICLSRLFFYFVAWIDDCFDFSYCLLVVLFRFVVLF